MKIIYLTSILSCALMTLVNAVDVTLPDGSVLRGSVERSRWKDRPYYAFRAIPYAQPPEGKNRFMPTVPGFKWEGVYDATQPRDPCAQGAFGRVLGVEDCLNVYVYTPKLPSAKNKSDLLPVIFWIHGGSFVVGSAANIRESLMMDRDVVLVIPQYRLGFLGFFKTQGGFSGGNMGLLDQVAALRWVQRNVAAFGGDLNRVIISGEDAGGAASIYHMMSPLTKGLFHGLISFSGSPLAPWAHMKFEHRFNLMVANILKCPAHDQSLLVKCFQEVELFELLNGIQMLMENRDPVVGNNRIGPTSQDSDDALDQDIFLKDHPLILLLTGNIHKVPVILGVTKDVGGYLVDMMLYDFIQFQLEENPKFLKGFLAMLLKECDIRNASYHEEEFKDFYFSNVNFDNLDLLLPGLTNMLGDIHYKASILSASRLLSKVVPTWVYRFEYEGGPNLFDIRYLDSTPPPMPPTVGHGDEVMLILPEINIGDFTQEQKAMSNKLLDMIENFARDQLPQDGWPMFTLENLATLVWESNGSTSIKSFASSEKIKMLNNIHSYHHRKILEAIRNDTLQSPLKNSHEEL